MDEKEPAELWMMAAGYRTLSVLLMIMGLVVASDHVVVGCCLFAIAIGAFIWANHMYRELKK